MQLSSKENNITPSKLAVMMLVMPIFGIVAASLLVVLGAIILPYGSNFQQFYYGLGGMMAIVIAILALYSWFIEIRKSRG